MDEEKRVSNKKRNVIIALLLLLIGILLIIFFYRRNIKSAKTMVYLSSEDLSHGDEYVTVDVQVSNLPDYLFPAVSTSVKFDNEALDLVEVVNGDMEVYENGETNSEMLIVPDWTYDIQAANESGSANLMYLDMSGGNQAFNINGFEQESKNTLFTLKFKLKNGKSSGDSLKFTIDEATLATVDDLTNDTGVSMVKGNLSAKNLSLKINQ